MTQELGTESLGLNFTRSSLQQVNLLTREYLSHC